LGRNVWAFGWVALVSLATVVAVPANQATMQMKAAIYSPFDGEPFDETLIVDVGLRPMLSQKISLNERLGSTGIKPPWDFYIVFYVYSSRLFRSYARLILSLLEESVSWI
jgi:hypothetical protein